MLDEATTPSAKIPRKRRRPQISCTECRRRKQKCKPRTNGPCENCLRRYPPVQCYVDNNAHHREETQSHSLSTSSRQYGLNSLISASSPARLELYRDTRSKQQSPTDTLPADYSEFLTPTVPSPSSQVIGGMIAAVNSSLTNVAIEPNLRNAELFHCFHQRVISSMTCIDSSHTPQTFLQEILPWMLQSYIMPHIAILMASAKESAENAVDKKRRSETIIIKSKVLGLFNDFLNNDFSVVGNAAIRAIFPLVTTEFLWGNLSNLWAHMRGLKQMINLKGGLEALMDPVLEQALIVTDYQLACYLEQDVLLQTTGEAMSRTVQVTPSYDSILCSPLVDKPKRFSDIRSDIGLDDLAANILDDVRFLTLSLLNAESNTEKRLKIRATAEWLHKRLDASELPPLTSPFQVSNAVTHVIHLTAKVYTSSIQNIEPLSDSCSLEVYESFHSVLAVIPTTMWKTLPGIWYWILLVVCPFGEKMRHTTPVAAERARWIRRKMAVAGTAIALADFSLGTLMVQRFWLVQRWIETAKQRKLGNTELSNDFSSSQ